MLRPGYGCGDDGVGPDEPVLRAVLWCCHCGGVMVTDGLGPTGTSLACVEGLKPGVL